MRSRTRTEAFGRLIRQNILATVWQYWLQDLSLTSTRESRNVGGGGGGGVALPRAQGRGLGNTVGGVLIF